MKLFISIVRDSRGTYIAQVPDLPGCTTWGNSYQEALVKIKDAIRIRLDADNPPKDIGPCLVNSLLDRAGMTMEDVAGYE